MGACRRAAHDVSMARVSNLPLRRAIGARLRTVRERAGWSQEALADAIGVAPPNVSRYETGKKALTIPTLAAAARALGVGLADLVAVEQAPPAEVSPPTGADQIEEQALLDDFRNLAEVEKKAVRTLLRSLARR